MKSLIVELIKPPKARLRLLKRGGSFVLRLAKWGIPYSSFLFWLAIS
jgi:hypothetical protein